MENEFEMFFLRSMYGKLNSVLKNISYIISFKIGRIIFNNPVS